ncbi:MAG: Cna B-type domain-containing protein [Eubacteriales bacterium]|nr:Cna B-type domain-containing protein [Eubacteriales bacterium]
MTNKTTSVIRTLFSVLMAVAIIVSMSIPVFAADEEGITPAVGEVLLSITKTWDDEGYETNRPESITVHLYRYTTNVADASPLADVTLNSANNWTGAYDISTLPYYDNQGNSYHYKWVEETISGYRETVHEDPDVQYSVPDTENDWNRITPCNQLSEETVNLDLTKPEKSIIAIKQGNHCIIWTPEKLTDIEREYAAAAVNKINGFHAEWNADGTITSTEFVSGIDGTFSNDKGSFTVDSTASTVTFSAHSTWAMVAFGTYTKSTADADKGAITNTYIPMIDVIGTKTWVDGGKEHNNASEITLTLTRISAKEGAAEETVEATPTWDGGTYTFSGMDQYDEEGYEYTYSVSEDEITGYTTAQSGKNFTNTITGTVDITGTKTWVDGGKEHDNASEITLTLTRKSAKEGAAEETVADATPTWDGNTYTFSGMDQYDAEGYEYTYSVSEEEVDGYKTVQDDFNFINTLMVDISGTKTWFDGGKEHDNATEITLKLTRISAKEGAEEETVEATPTWDGNTYTFSGLDQYDDEGYEYTYSVSEEEITGYSTVQNGYDFTNTIAGMIDISGTKTWIDEGKQHDNASEITLKLTRKSAKEGAEEEAVEATPTWDGNTYTFSGLDQYNDEGYEYTYSVSEAPIEGYKTIQDGFNFTNRSDYVPQTGNNPYFAACMLLMILSYLVVMTVMVVMKIRKSKHAC